MSIETKYIIVDGQLVPEDILDGLDYRGRGIPNFEKYNRVTTLQNSINPIQLQIDNKIKNDSIKHLAEENAKKMNLLNKGTGILQGTTGILNTFANNNEIKDLSNYDNMISEASSFQSTANSFNDLLNEWNTVPTLDNVNASNLRKSTGEYIGNTLKGTVEGALGGSAFGLPGVIVGGAAGLLSGITGVFTSGSKARKKANELNSKIQTINTNNQMQLNNRIETIKNNNYNNMMATYAALGGPLLTHGGLWDNGTTVINEGGTHEENPYGGVQLGIDPNGAPNLLEEGEVEYNNYVFSKRLKADKKLLKKYNIPNYSSSKSFAEIAEKFNKEALDMINDPIAKRGFKDSMMKLQMAQEEARMKKNNKKSNKYADGGEWLRYVPAVGSGLGTITDALGWTNKSDYTTANSIIEAANKLGKVNPNYISSYLPYTPMDKNYFLNDLNSQAAATRSAIRNQAGTNSANRIASLLALDHNINKSYGDLAVKASEYNNAKKKESIAYKADIDKYNSELAMKANLANLEQDKLRLNAALTRAQLMQQEDALASQGRSSNINTFLTNMGNIGKELMSMRMINDNQGLLYDYFGRWKNGILDNVSEKK